MDWPSRSTLFSVKRSFEISSFGDLATLTYVTRPSTLTYMEKTQIYFPKEELDALRKVAARSGRSVAAVVRDAVRAVILKPSDNGPVGIWDGKPKRTSLEHDSIYDEL